MSEDLKPCPFCGGEAHRGYNGPTKEQVQYAIGWGEDLDDGGSFIECMTCQASTALHYDRCENLVDAWNRRAAEAQVEALRKALESARGALMVAIRANVDLEGFDPASTMIIQEIDAALAGSSAKSSSNPEGN